MSKSVFLVWHAQDMIEEVDVKLLGVYSTRARAEQRVAAARSEPGLKQAAL